MVGLQGQVAVEMQSVHDSVKTAIEGHYASTDKKLDMIMRQLTKRSADKPVGQLEMEEDL